MTSLSSRLDDLSDIQKSKRALESWIQSQENAVAEMLKRPAKLRADAAQQEIAAVNSMRQAVSDRQSAVEEIQEREAAALASAAADHNLKIALDTLDEHVSCCFRTCICYNCYLIEGLKTVRMQCYCYCCCYCYC